MSVLGNSNERNRILNEVCFSSIFDFIRKDPSIYFNARDGILNLAIQQKALDPKDVYRIKDFDFLFDEEIISYTIPDTEQKVYIAFEEIQDPKVSKALNTLITEVDKHLGSSESRIKVSSKAKGELNGKEALLRETDATKALSSDFKASSKEMLPKLLYGQPKELCNVVTRRHLFIEYVLKMVEKFDEKIKKKEEELSAVRQAQSTPETVKIQAQLEKALNELKARKDAFEKIDGYALTLNLCTHPGSSHGPEHLDQAAKILDDHIRKELTDSIQQTLNAQKSRWKLWKPPAKAQLDKNDEAYIQGVKGMLYTSRSEYFKYCQKNYLKQKKERLEDILLREAVKFAGDPNYKPDTLINSLIFDGMPESVKEELDADLRDIGKLAPHAIGHIQESEFTPEPHPDGATEKQKQEIDLENFKQLNKDIESMKSRVNHDLTIDQLPKEPVIPEPAVGIQRYMPGRKTVIASAAVAGLFTGTTQSVASYVWNNLGSCAFLVFQGSRVKNEIASILSSRTEVIGGLAVAGTAGALSYAAMHNPSQILASTVDSIRNNPAMSYALLHTARAAISSLAHSGEGVDRRLSRRRIVGLLAGAGAMAAAYTYGDSSYIPDSLQTVSQYAIGATGWAVQQAWNYAFPVMILENIYRADVKKLSEAESKAPEWTKGAIQFQIIPAKAVQGLVNGVNAVLPQPLKTAAGSTYRLASDVARVGRITSFARSALNMLPDFPHSPSFVPTSFSF